MNREKERDSGSRGSSGVVLKKDSERHKQREKIKKQTHTYTKKIRNQNKQFPKRKDNASCISQIR